VFNPSSFTPDKQAKLEKAVEQSHLHVLASKALTTDISTLTTTMKAASNSPLDALNAAKQGPLCPPTPQLEYNLHVVQSPPSNSSSDTRLHQLTASIERLNWQHEPTEASKSYNSLGEKTMKKAAILQRHLVLLGYKGPMEFSELVEADVLYVLHFLCVQVNPSFEGMARGVFPLTPASKTTLKKLLQQQIEPHVLAKRLPIGSSNMSRLSTIATHSTRIIDLMWRLSTIAMQTHLGMTDEINTMNGTQLLRIVQAKIAMKTRQIEQTAKRRAYVQMQWKEKAKELTKELEQVIEMENKHNSEYAAWKSNIPQQVLTSTGHQERQKEFDRLKLQWQLVDKAVGSCPLSEFSSILNTVEAHQQAPPVLHTTNPNGILAALHSTTHAIRALHDQLQVFNPSSFTPDKQAKLEKAVEQSHLHVLASKALTTDISTLT
ncbi:hypothetical protein THRCLA_00174, partial [Thraustotheca clavata]